jgi:DNA-binding response OmpR family regulator
MPTSILIIDDSDNIRSSIVATLREVALFEQYLEAKDGIDGLKSLIDNRVDLIICDLEMPRMDGFKFLAMLSGREELKDIPVIMLTGKEDRQSKIKGLEQGAVDYVTKPFNPPELFARIGTHIEFERAKEEIHTLRGIVPVCAACKRIRDRSGSWETMESYISARSEAEFTHGLCPECIRKLYPEEAAKLFGNQKKKSSTQKPAAGAR